MTSPVCLVTGADGFIGRALCAHLQAKGWQVRRFLHGASASTASDFYGDIGSDIAGEIAGDITDSDSLRPAMAGVDIVFHLAGIAHTAGQSAARYEQVNVLGSEAVAEVAAECGVKRLVFFSSSQVEAAEDGRLPLTPYIKSKQQAEQHLRQRMQQSADNSAGLELCILRPAHVYGPGMKGGIATMLRLIQTGRLPRLPQLSGCLSMLGLGDLCELAARAAISKQAAGKTLALSDGHSYGVNAIESQIYRVLASQQPRQQPRRLSRRLFHRRCPAVILYLAAAVAEVLAYPLNRLRPGSFGFGMGSYRALVSDQTVDSRAARKLLGTLSADTQNTQQESFEDFLQQKFTTTT